MLSNISMTYVCMLVAEECSHNLGKRIFCLIALKPLTNHYSLIKSSYYIQSFAISKHLNFDFD